MRREYYEHNKKINSIGSASRTGTHSPVFHRTNPRDWKQTIADAHSRIIMRIHMRMETWSVSGIHHTTPALFAILHAGSD